MGKTLSITNILFMTCCQRHIIIIVNTCLNFSEMLILQDVNMADCRAEMGENLAFN